MAHAHYFPAIGVYTWGPHAGCVNIHHHIATFIAIKSRQNHPNWSISSIARLWSMQLMVSWSHVGQRRQCQSWCNSGIGRPVIITKIQRDHSWLKKSSSIKWCCCWITWHAWITCFVICTSQTQWYHASGMVITTTPQTLLPTLGNNYNDCNIDVWHINEIFNQWHNQHNNKSILPPSIPKSLPNYQKQ